MHNVNRSRDGPFSVVTEAPGPDYLSLTPVPPWSRFRLRGSGCRVRMPHRTSSYRQQQQQELKNAAVHAPRCFRVPPSVASWSHRAAALRGPTRPAARGKNQVFIMKPTTHETRVLRIMPFSPCAAYMSFRLVAARHPTLELATNSLRKDARLLGDIECARKEATL